MAVVRAATHTTPVSFQGQLGVASVADEIARLVAKGRAREVGQVTTLPPGVPEVTVDQLKSLFDPSWYKQWWVWALAGTAVAGGTLYFWRRRRK